MKVFNSDKGFTIIETMVAIAILAVGTLGVGTMLMLSLSSGTTAAQTRRAESVCMQWLEGLKATPGKLAPGTYLSTAQPLWPDPSFVSNWTVSNYQWSDTGANAGLSQVDITVGWPRDTLGICTAATTQACKNKFSVTTYFRPLPPSP